jgi:hypothetical protein
MLKIQRIPMAILLMLSIATVSLAGTITGGRTSTSRTGTIVGGRTGTIVGGRTGTIVGGRTGTIVGGRTGTIVGGRMGIIPTEADQGFRGKVQDDLLAQLTLLITHLAW